MRKVASFIGVVVFLMGVSLAFAAEEPSRGPEAPAKGMVTMVDLGAGKCIPCKMMAPVLESLEKDYAGKAAIIFIDVWENKDQGKRFGIRSIPTQIFYDKTGKEVYRHEGFLAKESAMSKLEELGVESPRPDLSSESNK